MIYRGWDIHIKEWGIWSIWSRGTYYLTGYWKIKDYLLESPRVRHSVQRAPFGLRALFGVRAPFIINVPLTILSSYLPMDYLFQITFDGLFVSDNIYGLKMFKIIFHQIHA